MINTWCCHDTSNKIVIPWSGGVDSTAILLAVCEYIKTGAINDVDLYLISVNDTLTLQGVSEKRARLRILKYISQHYPVAFEAIKYREMDKEFTAVDFNGNDLLQPFWWLTAVYGKFGANTTFLFGYHKGDDFWSAYDKFATMENAINSYFVENHNQYVSYPFALCYKDEIYDTLPNDVKPLISWCEQPSDKLQPCGECGSCITHFKFIKS